MTSGNGITRLFREPVARKVLYLSLTFIISFAAFFTTVAIQQRSIDEYQRQIENQQARSSLGKAILHRLLLVGIEAAKLMDATDARSVDILHTGMEDNLNSISRVLGVLQDGGTFINALPANFYEMDEVYETIAYTREADAGYVVEVIDLAPKIMELRDYVSDMARLRKEILSEAREGDRKRSDERLHVRLMSVEALLLRARESASKVFHDTQRVIQRLTDLKETAITQGQHARMGVLAFTIVVCGLLFFRLFFQIRSILRDRQVKTDNLNEAKEVIETILDSVPVGVIIVNGKKEVVRANSEALRLFEASGAEAVLGKRCDNLFCLSTGASCPLESDLSQSHKAEIKIATFSGKTVTVLKQAVGISLYGEQFILEAFMDITRRREMEERLQQEQLYANAVLQGVQAGVVVIDAANHTIVDMNESAARLIGVRREDALGVKCHQYICPAEQGRCPVSDLGQNVDHAVRTLTNGKSVLKSVVPFHRKGGVYLIESFVDISDRVQVEKDLQEALEAAAGANKAKSEFLSRMSHELRTPLNAIVGFSDLLLEGKNNTLTKETATRVERIKVAGQHLTQMISQVLDYSKIESGNFDVNCEAVTVKPVIDECLGFVEQAAAANRISIHAASSLANLPPVWTDPMRFKQVVLNLLSNAVKYNRKNGYVTVEGVAHDCRVRLLVTDTGIGIPEAKQQDLFKPFARFVDEGSGIEGTGIGMAITKQIVASMGGTIDFESNEAVGTTFTVELPSAVESCAGAIPDADASQELQEASLTVLYIDEDADVMSAAKAEMARWQGVTMVGRKSLEKGVKAMRLMKPDLVLVNIDTVGPEVGAPLREASAEVRTASHGTPPLLICLSAGSGTVAETAWDGCLDLPLDVDALQGLYNQHKGTNDD